VDLTAAPDENLELQSVDATAVTKKSSKLRTVDSPHLAVWFTEVGGTKSLQVMRVLALAPPRLCYTRRTEIDMRAWESHGVHDQH